MGFLVVVTREKFFWLPKKTHDIGWVWLNNGFVREVHGADQSITPIDYWFYPPPAGALLPDGVWNEP